MAMVIQLRDRDKFNPWNGGEQGPDVFRDAIDAMVFVQRHALVDRVGKQASDVCQMLDQIPGDVLHRELWGFRFEDKILHMDVTGWAPAQDVLRRKGRHVVERLCRLSMRQGGLSGAHERNAATIARAAEDFVIHP